MRREEKKGYVRRENEGLKDELREKSPKPDVFPEDVRKKRGGAGAEQNGILQDPAPSLKSFRCGLLRLPHGQLLHAGRLEPSVLKDSR